MTQGIEDYLRNAAIDFKAHVVNGSTTTCQDAASQLHVPLQMIIKTIVFTNDKNSPIIAILTGDKRVDKRKLSATVGTTKVKIATPEATKEFTGFEVGTMPPVGHKARITTVIDHNVMRQNKVYGGYGIPKVLIEIDPHDIAQLTDAEISDISE